VSRRVVVTSVVRYAVPTEMSGWFRVVDLESGDTTFKALVPESVWRRHDANPRGGTRGTRGVSVHGGRLVMAGAERLYVFDTQWRLVDELTHRLMADVHDVLAGVRGIWVASTGCDVLLLYGWDGDLLETWPLREDERLMEEFGRPGHWLPPLDPDVDYRDPRVRMNVFDALHLNGLARGAGGLLLSLGRVTTQEEDVGRAGISALVRFDGDGFEILHRHQGVAVPNHNVAEAGGRLLYNDSNRHCLVVHDRKRDAETGTISIPGDPPFVRGLAQIEPGVWLVGSQAPLAFYAVDVERGKRVAEYRLGGGEHEAVYGICPLPEAFADPELPDGTDPYAFWKRAALPPTVTPIPGLRA
jgi:hypothetical protein